MVKYMLVLWSLDTIDWQHASPSTIERRILSRAQGGDIILMHPTTQTVAALPTLIKGLRSDGLQLVTLNQLLSPQWPPAPQASGGN